MNEEMEQQLDSNVSIGVETISSEPKVEKSLDDFPRLEDLIKSEKEVKVNQQIEGVTKVESNVHTEDRVFKKKSEERKIYLKRRIKIVTSVYVCVLALLLTFVGVNIATLAILNKDINSNANTIREETIRLEMLEADNPNIIPGEIQISLNEPRDYSEDKKELTFLDKITIVFRNLFG